MIDTELQLAPPEALSISPAQWMRVLRFADELCQSRTVPALSFQLQRRGMTTGVHTFGTRVLGQSAPVDDETLFLVASLTKPMVAMATLLLVQHGELALNDKVHKFIPEFSDAAKRPITIRHLLTHTSGLPDMLPDNLQLRSSQAPLKTFVEQTCQADLLFPPGRSAQYQSMGYALLGAVIEKVTGIPCRDFLHHELFGPLGMKRTWLGLDSSEDESNIAEIAVPASQRGGEDWNWNSRYWRELGAPWGGVLATVSDVSRFCRKMLLSGHNRGDYRLFSATTIRDALENRLHDFPSIPESERRTRGWGLGWRLNWKDHRSCFCELLPDEIVGHWGATGTLFWLDRRREIAAVILSTCPLNDDVSPLTRLSNMIAAAFADA